MKRLTIGIGLAALLGIIAVLMVVTHEKTEANSSEAGQNRDPAINDSQSGVTEVGDNRSLGDRNNRNNRANRRKSGETRNGTNQNAERTDGVETDQWDDPINQEVLGPKKWMAELSPQEIVAIEEVFQKAEAQRDKRIDRVSRQNSIDVMKTAVGACLDELRETLPDATGRLIVEWTASVSNDGAGVISDIDIATNVGLRQESFERCVLGATRLKFAATPGDPLRVEYPFMYDVEL